MFIYKFLVGRVFAHGLGDRSSIPGRVIPTTKIIVFDATLLNTQHYHIYHPSARAGYDTRSIFKRSLTGLNSEFSFS